VSRRALGGLLAAALLCAGCATARKGKPAGPPVAEIPGLLQDVVTADLEGDGVPALYVLAPRSVARATLEPGGGWTLQPLYKIPPGGEWLGLSAGDVDGDGRDELVGWSATPGASSVVLALRDGELERTAPRVARVLRAVEVAGVDEIWGQKGGNLDPLEGPIHRWDWVVDHLEQGERIPSQSPANLLDGFRGPDPEGGGTAEYAFNERGELERWVGQAPVWRSEDVRMARPRMVEREHSNLLGERQTVVDSFATAVTMTDVDGDGRDEVWMVTSDPAPVRVLERVQVFRGGQFLLLGVDERGLAVRARSILLGRYATGVAPFDVDGDGDLEAVVTVVLKQGGTAAWGKSTIVVFDAETGDLTELGRPVE